VVILLHTIGVASYGALWHVPPHLHLPGYVRLRITRRLAHNYNSLFFSMHFDLYKV